MPDRDQLGRFVRGNRAALVVGERSAAFWTQHEQARRDLRTAVIIDAGHREADAPKALQLAADSIAQTTLLQASALHTSSSPAGRLRRAGGRAAHMPSG